MLPVFENHFILKYRLVTYALLKISLLSYFMCSLLILRLKICEKKRKRQKQNKSLKDKIFMLHLENIRCFVDLRKTVFRQV